MFSLARRACGFLALLSAVLSPLALADPPDRVGRLAYVENEVNYRVDRDDAGAPAAINWPISTGALLDTGRGGRTEVWVGSTAYRLAGNSQVEFVGIDDRQVALQLSGGTLAVSILDRDQVDDIAIGTPDGQVRFNAPGRYRIDVLSDHTVLTTQAGLASLDDGGGTTRVAAGQKARLYAGGQARLETDTDRDSFDSWVADRENATMAGDSRRYVSPYMTGYQDLDAYGDWQSAGDYGTVWYPRTVADDWAPYRDGRWAWVEPWGWTWVDQAPWGFAPFHYGRWVLIGSRWAWAPGHRMHRPVYAPALVGWIGNPGWSLHFRSGSAPAVGWFPLAPREVYVPAYRHSSGYVRHLNESHVSDVRIIDRAVRAGGQDRFAHREQPRAVTVVPSNLMREGRPIRAPEILRPDRSELGRAPRANHAPTADWLQPPSRPRGEPGRRGPGTPEFRQVMPAPDGNLRDRDGRRFEPRREGGPDSRRDLRPDRGPSPVPEGTAPSRRIEVTPAPPDGRPGDGRRFDPTGREGGPDGRRDLRPDRGPASGPEGAAPSRRIEVTPTLPSGRPNEGRRIEPPVREAVPEPRRDFRPERVPPAPAMPEAAPPRRIEVTPPAPPPVRQEMAPPRRDERPAMPAMPESRREMPRIERPEPPALRQREMPQAPPAPAFRAPPPQVAPPPAPPPVPRAEPPHQQEQRGGGDRGERQRGGDERGPR